jgi:hypothetical protein
VKAYEYSRQTIEHFKISWKVIEDIVRTYYNDRQYSFVAVEECGNDTCHEFFVTGRVVDYQAAAVERFRSGEGYGALSNYDIFDVLCQDGFLDPGTYIVEVCW